MPRTRSLAWSELKIGIVSIVALVLADVLIFLLSGGRRLLLAALLAEDAVQQHRRPQGGRARSASPASRWARSRRRLRRRPGRGRPWRSRRNIASGSRPSRAPRSDRCRCSVRARSTSRRRARARRSPSGATFQPGRPAGSIAEVATQATAGIEEATELLQDIRAGRGTVGKLFTDEALYRDVNELVGRPTASPARSPTGAARSAASPPIDALYNDAVGLGQRSQCHHGDASAAAKAASASCSTIRRWPIR